MYWFGTPQRNCGGILNDPMVYLVRAGGGHGAATGWEYSECPACLLAREIGAENCNWKIPDVPERCDCAVPGGYIVWELGMYLELNIQGKLWKH